jgi:hypothetical protein
VGSPATAWAVGWPVVAARVATAWAIWDMCCHVGVVSVAACCCCGGARAPAVGIVADGVGAVKVLYMLGGNVGGGGAVWMVEALATAAAVFTASSSVAMVLYLSSSSLMCACLSSGCARRSARTSSSSLKGWYSGAGGC